MPAYVTTPPSVMPVSPGRPRRYPTAELLREAVEAYLYDCYLTNEPLTSTGLALSLGFASRQAIYKYKEFGDDYAEVINRAMLYIEHGLVLDTLRRDKGHQGPIFVLRNMWQKQDEADYNDKQQSIITGAGGGPVQMEDTSMTPEERLGKLKTLLLQVEARRKVEVIEGEYTDESDTD